MNFDMESIRKIPCRKPSDRLNLALKIRENSPGVLHTLGITYALLGEYESQLGKIRFQHTKRRFNNIKRSNKSISPSIQGMKQELLIGSLLLIRWIMAKILPSSFRHSIEAIPKILKESPDDPYMLYNLGMVYTRSRKL